MTQPAPACQIEASLLYITQENGNCDYPAEMTLLKPRTTAWSALSYSCSELWCSLLCVCFFTGEINTLQGNLNWVASREHSLTHPVWNGREEEFLPICNQAESDSANLDHLAEYAVRTGVDPRQTLMMLVPEAYNNHPDLLKDYPEVGLSAQSAQVTPILLCVAPQRTLGPRYRSSASVGLAAA